MAQDQVERNPLAPKTAGIWTRFKVHTTIRTRKRIVLLLEHSPGEPIDQPGVSTEQALRDHLDLLDAVSPFGMENVLAAEVNDLDVILYLHRGAFYEPIKPQKIRDATFRLGDSPLCWAEYSYATEKDFLDRAGVAFDARPF